ncbi:LytTR family DNA-binding domain-containing protein [uncultured Arcticibacterium sp.]|uniref:LytTR family DNA-binding domain-containing protein n=1 Tax=uncultured Arcticibacterium sp. TaxID=2173042 RepID=UPI0030F9F7D1
METIHKIRIGGHLFAQPQDLLKLEARENYTQIYFRSGKEVLVATTIGLLEERLTDHGFYRTDRGAVVNMSCVKSLYRNGRKMRVRLNNNDLMKVSKRRINDMLNLSIQRDIDLIDNHTFTY